MKTKINKKEYLRWIDQRIGLIKKENKVRLDSMKRLRRKVENDEFP